MTYQPYSQSRQFKLTRLVFLVPILLSVEFRIRLQGSFSFTLAELSTLVVWMVIFLQICFGYKNRWRKQNVVLVSLIAYSALLSVLWSTDKQHALSVYRDYITPLLFFLGMNAVRLTPKQVIGLIKLFIFVSAVSALLGIVQYLTGQYQWFQSADLSVFEAYKIGFIKSSTIGHLLGVKDSLAVGFYSMPTNFSEYLIVPCIVCAALIGLPLLGWFERFIWRLAFIILCIGLLFTFTRSSQFIVVAALITYRVVHKSKRAPWGKLLIALVLSIILIAIIILSGFLNWDSLGTATGRISMAGAALALLRDQPQALLTGGFTELYLTKYHDFQVVHNIYLYSILQFGLIATFGWLLLVGSTLLSIIKLARSKTPVAKAFGLAIFCSLTCIILLYAQTTTLLDSIQSSMCLFFWLGIGYQIYCLQRPALNVYQPNRNLQEERLLTQLPKERPRIAPIKASDII